MRARKPSSSQRANRALVIWIALLAQLGCADDAATPPVLRPEVPAPTLDTSIGRPLDGGSPEASVIEAGMMDARGPLLDAALVDGAAEWEGGQADARLPVGSATEL